MRPGETRDLLQPLDRRVADVVRAGVWLALAAVAIQSLVHGANLVLLHRRFALLDAESDISFWAWASTAAMAVAAGFATLLAVAVRSGRWRLLLLGALLAFLSADDILALHERISIAQLGPIPHASRLVWPIVFGPPLGLAFVLLWLEARDAAAGIRRTMLQGLAALAVAILMEAGTPVLFALGFDHGTAPYELEVVVEEGLELGGVILVATGLGAMLAVAFGSPRPAEPTEPTDARRT